MRFQKLRKSRIFLNLAVTIFAAGCNNDIVPVDLGGACSPENNGKYVALNGFITPSLSVFCSGKSGRNECGFLVKERLDRDEDLRVAIEQATTANSVEKSESGYTKDNIRIRDDTGSVIDLSEKVHLTGQMRVVPGEQVCYMRTTKIERQK